jgi:hypothetical protein
VSTSSRSNHGPTSSPEARGDPLPFVGRRDLLVALASDHRLLSSRGQRLLDDETTDARAIDRWAGSVTVHALIEELVVEPLMRGPLARPDVAERRREERRALLRVMDGLRDRPRIGRAELRGVVDRFVDHGAREEAEVFPALRRAVPPGDLVAAWHRFVVLRTRIPSRCAMLAGPRSWRSATAREVAGSLEPPPGGRGGDEAEGAARP